MKTKLIFTLFLFFSTTLLGQTIKSNKAWLIEGGHSFCDLGDITDCWCYNGSSITKTGDTITFNGKEYYELLYYESGLQQWDVVNYVREEGNKIFFYVEKCDTEHLMYDFDLNVGDTVFLADPRNPFSGFNQNNRCEFTEYDSLEYQYIVTEVDSIEYNQVKRKMLKLESRMRPFLSDIWVEEIGCMRGINNIAASHTSGVRQLKACYESDSLIFVNENPEYCWIYTSTIIENRQWHIETGYACPEGDDTGCFCYNGLITVKTGGFRVFNEQYYYELLLGDSGQQWDTITFVREAAEGKVYFYSESCDKEYLLYDFNLNVGDTVVLIDPLHPTSLNNPNNPCQLTAQDTLLYSFIVTEIDTIECMHYYDRRKRLRLESLYNQLEDIWVEGIGSMRGIPFNTAQQISGVRQLKDCYGYDKLFFVNENPQYCWVEPVVNAINEFQQDLIQVFMDENNRLHIVNAEGISFILYDIQGKKVQSFFPKDNHPILNMSHLPKGLYLLSNKTNNTNFKVIVQ